MYIIRLIKFIFHLFIIISILTASASYSTENTRDEDTTLINTLYQIKYVIMNKFTSGDIVNLVEQAIEKGAVGCKVVQPMFSFLKDMGWLIEDSKGREVFRVLFTFKDNGIVNNGRYLGPLISKEAQRGTDQQIYQFHVDILSRNYKLISPDNYNLGDGCRGVIKLFKSDVSDPGRTAIIVECPN